MRAALRPRGHLPRTRRRTQTGVAIIELTMVATLLLVLLLGVIEIGRGLNEYKILVNQVDAAARYLASRPPGAGYAEAECLLRYSVTTCNGNNRPPEVLPGLGVEQSTKVDIFDSSDKKNDDLLRARTGADTTDTVGVRVNLVRVTVSRYKFRILSGNTGDALFDAKGGNGNLTIDFPDISSVQRQFAG